MLLFCSCVSTDYNTTGTNQQNASNNSNTSKKTGNTIAYILENGEKLRTLIFTQDDLNSDSKFENEPTNTFYKEKFSEYEKLTNEVIDDQLKKLTEEEKKRLVALYGYPNNEILENLKKSEFLYKIEYNSNKKAWYIELIGRSTTLKIVFSNVYSSGHNFYGSNLRSWMDLNNIKDLDYAFRIYINDIDDNIIPELFGMQLK
jgi:hypothetical protein